MDDPTLYGKGTKPEMDPLRAKFKSRINYKGFRNPTEKMYKSVQTLSYAQRKTKMEKIKK